MKILSAGGVKNVRIVEILDNFGENKHYELYSGCYSKAMEAIKAMKAVSWATKTLNLTQKPRNSSNISMNLKTPIALVTISYFQFTKTIPG